MSILPVASLQTLAAEMTMQEKAISSAKVILTGFVVVFAVLFLLIAIIKIYGAIVGKVQNIGQPKKSAKPVEKVKIEKENTVISASAPQPENPDGIEEELIAVIATAVAQTYGEQKRVRIKSIKKSGGGRSAWANAGVLDNTKPF